MALIATAVTSLAAAQETKTVNVNELREFPLDAPYELEVVPDAGKLLEEMQEFLGNTKAARASLVGVIRAGENSHGTWGLLYVHEGGDWKHKGHTLEPRSTVGKGPIPLGDYAFKRWMSPKLKKTLRLYNVPGFTDILVHVGNTQSDTKGCILAAYSVDSTTKPTRLVNSRKLTDWLYDNHAAGEIRVRSK